MIMILRERLRFSHLYIRKHFLGNLQQSEPWEGSWVGGAVVDCKEGNVNK